MLLLLLIDFISIKCETFSHGTVQASEHRASYRENTAMGTCSYNYSCRAVQLWEQVAIPQGNTAVGTCNYMAVGQYSCGDMQLYRRAVQLWEHVAIWLQGYANMGLYVGRYIIAAGPHSCRTIELCGCTGEGGGGIEHCRVGMSNCRNTDHRAVGLYNCENNRTWKCGAVQLWEHTTVRTYSCRVIQL